MVAVTARTAAGLQVEAQASLDSRKHERRTDGKPGQGRTIAAYLVARKYPGSASADAPAVCAEAWTQPATVPVVCAQVPVPQRMSGVQGARPQFR